MSEHLPIEKLLFDFEQKVILIKFTGIKDWIAYEWTPVQDIDFSKIFDFENLQRTITLKNKKDALSN